MAKTLSPQQAADEIGVSRPTIYAWVHDGYIKALKKPLRGRDYYRIPVSEVQRVKRERALKPYHPD